MTKKELEKALAKLPIPERAEILSELYEWASGVRLHPKTIQGWLNEKVEQQK